jgi:hypothetical protein
MKARTAIHTEQKETEWCRCGEGIGYVFAGFASIDGERMLILMGPLGEDRTKLDFTRVGSDSGE